MLYLSQVNKYNASIQSVKRIKSIYYFKVFRTHQRNINVNQPCGFEIAYDKILDQIVNDLHAKG